MILVILLPFLVVGLTLADNVKELYIRRAKMVWCRSAWAAQRGWPRCQSWASKLPDGRSLATDSAKLLEATKHFIQQWALGLLVVSVAIGSGILHLALSILDCFLYFPGPSRAR